MNFYKDPFRVTIMPLFLGMVIDLTIWGAAAYAQIKPSEDANIENYTYNIGLRYDDRQSLQAELFGRFIQWDLDEFFQANHGDFIWNLNLNKKICTHDKKNLEIFFTATTFLTAPSITSRTVKTPADGWRPDCG